MPTKTFETTKNLPVVTNSSGQNNPGDLHLPIGKWDPGTGLSWVTRALLYAPVSFSGMTAINEARLYLRAHHPGSGWHAQGNGTVLLESRRKTADWNESSGGSGTGTDELWGGSGESLVTSNNTNPGDGTSSFNADSAAGTWDYLVITECVRDWFNGSPNYGLMVMADDEASAGNAEEFWSRRSAGDEPYIWIDYDTNTAPNAPTGLSPSGGETVNTGRTITYEVTRSDPDSGDYITLVQTQLRPSGGSTIDDWTYNPAGTPTSVSYSRTLPSGYNATQVYEWRARTRDRESVWGPYSAWQSFRPNTKPNAPSGLGEDLDTLIPTFVGSSSDPDPSGTGASLDAVEVEVQTNDGLTTKWDSGTLSMTGTSFSKAYAGTALAWGTAYRWRARVRDALLAWSSWTAYRTFTPTQPSGPDNMTPRTTATKANTLTPTLTVGHSALFRNERIQVYAANSLSSTLLWDKAKDGVDYANTTSKARTYAGTALAWGGTYYWRALVELSDGTDTAWSDLKPFYINALPTAPTVTVMDSATSIPAVLSGGVQVTTDSTPKIAAPFVDPDKAGYADAPSARHYQVRRKDTQALHQETTTGTTEDWTLTVALTADVVYQVRVGYRDNAGQPAGTYVYSAWTDLKYTQGPTATLVSPANASSVTESTPTLDWSYASAAGKAQAYWEVLVYDKGPTGANYTDEALVYDSNITAGTTTAHDIPLGVLEDDHDYRWEVRVWDTDGLLSVLS